MSAWYALADEHVYWIGALAHPAAAGHPAACGYDDALSPWQVRHAMSNRLAHQLHRTNAEQQRPACLATACDKHDHAVILSAFAAFAVLRFHV